MKIIVTGGAGFIASHVVDAYVKAGHKVAVVDNLSHGLRKNVNPRAKFYNADIRYPKQLATIFKKERPQAANHHAALISVTQSVKEPRETFITNAEGTLNVVLALANSPAAGKKKFLFSSTGGAIYGNPKKLPADESTPPNPFSPYALAKEIAEKLIAYHAKSAGMDYLIFRYANVYGPRQQAVSGAGIFPIFTKLMRAGKQPTIFGNGRKTRDYVYVEDVAHANLLGLTRGKNTIINIATAQETSDREIFDAIAETLRFTKGPRFAPSRAGEVMRISMSYGRAKKILGWEPRYHFEEGARKAVLGIR